MGGRQALPKILAFLRGDSVHVIEDLAEELTRARAPADRVETRAGTRHVLAVRVGVREDRLRDDLLTHEQDEDVLVEVPAVGRDATSSSVERIVAVDRTNRDRLDVEI